MNKKGIESWEWLMIIGALIIIAWALFKAFGIIHSPVWVDMVPYFGGGISILGVTYQLGRIKRGIEQTEEKLGLADKKIDKLLLLEPRLVKLESEHNLAMQGKIKH